MVWETVAHFLPEEWKPYFDHAQFKKGPLYHAKSEHLEIVLMVDEVFPFELYETLLHNLKLQTHVHVNLGIEARHAKTDMVNLDRYVAYFVEKEPRLKDFRFLHPFMENESVAFSTKDESRLAKLNLSLPILESLLKEVGIEMDMICKQIEDDKAIESQRIEMPSV